MTRLVAVNENGQRIGETHHNATIPDEVVAAIRDLHEEQRIGYRRLARMFLLHVETVKKLCRYQRRAQVPKGWKRVPAPDGKTAGTSAGGNRHGNP